MVVLVMYDIYFGMFLVGVGIFLTITAVVGIIRFPNFYTRIHSAGIVDSLASTLILIGAAMQNGFSTNTFKIILLILLIWITATTSSYALARTCYNKQNYD